MRFHIPAQSQTYDELAWDGESRDEEVGHDRDSE